MRIKDKVFNTDNEFMGVIKKITPEYVIISKKLTSKGGISYDVKTERIKEINGKLFVAPKNKDLGFFFESIGGLK